MEEYAALKSRTALPDTVAPLWTPPPPAQLLAQHSYFLSLYLHSILAHRDIILEHTTNGFLILLLYPITFMLSEQNSFNKTVSFFSLILLLSWFRSVHFSLKSIVITQLSFSAYTFPILAQLPFRVCKAGGLHSLPHSYH